MEKTKIGIPRGMLYYEFYPIWEEYFRSFNYEIISSPLTNKEILNKGIMACVDEACLPVKTFHGHVEYLKDKVDYILIPKIISLYKKEYCCPKILGLPDMIKHNIKDLPDIIDTKIDLGKRTGFKNSLKDIENNLKLKKISNYNNYKNLGKNTHEHLEWLKTEVLEDIYIDSSQDNINLLILGHSYNIFDEFLNMNILKKMKEKNIHIRIIEEVSEEKIRYYSDLIPKRMFWTHGRRIVGGAYALMHEEKIDGIIYLNSFGCGLDSVLAYLVNRKANENHIPIMELTLDEQTGEAGFNTRLEAFLDMMEWRNKSEDNISASR